MPTLKEYNVKLTRLRSTRKMTKTMKMVSANKLRKAQDAQKRAAAFGERVNAIVSRIHDPKVLENHPLLTVRNPASRVLVVVFTSDRGLCGGFNNNLSRSVLRWVTTCSERQVRAKLSFCGRRGFLFLRHRAPLQQHYENVAARIGFTDACRIGREMQALFLDGTFDEIYLASNVFHSPLSQTPAIERLLPVAAESIAPADECPTIDDWLFDPPAPDLLARLLPWLVNLQIYAALLGTATGEHGARMTAMDNATRNTDTLIDTYTLRRNRARQWNITMELTEIVAGAEALK